MGKPGRCDIPKTAILAMNSPESHQKTVGHKVKIYIMRKNENKKRPQNLLEKRPFSPAFGQAGIWDKSFNLRHLRRLTIPQDPSLDLKDLTPFDSPSPHLWRGGQGER
jgi:hypothetical protein